MQVMTQRGCQGVAGEKGVGLMEHKAWHKKAQSKQTTSDAEGHVNKFLANSSSDKIMEHLMQVMTHGGRSGGCRGCWGGEGSNGAQDMAQ